MINDLRHSTKKYAIKNDTFIHVANDEKADFLETEIGDIKQPGFYPQVKIKRFDNEYNFSARLKHNERGAGKVTNKNGKIVWKKGELEAHFYDLEDGYEFEVVYKKKPTSNRVEFTIQTKGLRFLYQGALGTGKIARNSRRPENVIGSYAVYAEKVRKTYTGGKRYGTGKVGHIYRPKITDALGQEVWGQLEIDTKKGILCVVVPQEFLDNATYPIIVDPTIGYNTVGGTELDVGNDWGAICNKYNPVYAVTGDVVTQYHFYGRKLAANETIALNMYRLDEDTFEPLTKHGGSDQSVNVNSTTRQWWNSSVVSQALTAGYVYGVAFGGFGGTPPNENTEFNYDDDFEEYTSENSATSLSSTWNESFTYAVIFSIYATYTRAPVTIRYSFNLFIDKGKI